ncbi:mucin-6-like [Uloborus diversus]|uniref:mucin-6-like n=1 Tax=Uloborus diversus TaxID=327109 RepID=UPI00240970D7|nr:mucin-6-like [Uloborus diversus]
MKPFFLVLFPAVLAVATADQVCGVNEEYTDCGFCEPTCENPHPEVCAQSCTPGCYCKSGYLRNSNRICVSPEECNAGNCGPDQVYVSQIPCKNTCREYLYVDACGSRGPGCTCTQPGYYILEQNGLCVSAFTCEVFYGGNAGPAQTDDVQMDDGSVAQPPSYNCDSNKGQTYSTCVRCYKTCDAHFYGGIACAQSCIPGCDCIQNDQYMRSDGTCVPEQYCYTTNCQCSSNDYSYD